MFSTVFDFSIYLLFRFFLWVLYILPKNLVLGGLGLLAKFVVKYNEQYQKVILINLGFAYPEKSEQWKLSFLDDLAKELARTFYDVIRIPHLSKEWIKDHITLDNVATFNDYYERNIPIIFVTGHLGSFELLIYSCSLLKKNTTDIIVRSFKNKFLDRYWNAIRERYGSRMIRKDGAYKASIMAINNCADIGFPFDQNQKKCNAVFVDFFGKKAATSKTLAILALRHNIPVVFASMMHLDHDKYIIRTKECFYSDIYNDLSLNHSQKIEAFTARAMKIFEDQVREFPAGWFWMHRRWKTRPEGEKRFY